MLCDDGGLKILSHEQAEIYRKQGWKAADLHVHTLCSLDVIPDRSMHPAALYRRAKEWGMDFVTFTDHDTMRAYDLLSGELDGLVTGVEMRIKDLDLAGHTLHINVYDLSGEQFLELKEISEQGDLRSFINYLVKNNLPYIYNHPLWFEHKERPNLAAIPELVRLFPVLEYNMHRVHRKNEITMALARRYKKGLAASTDSHAGNLGKVYTLSHGDSFREFFENICNGSSYIVVKDLTKLDIIQEMNRWIELIFSPDIPGEIKEYSLGVAYLDKIINILSGETIRSFPWICKAAQRASHKISNSGLPASLYLRSEGALLPEIEEQLSFILR
jgi:predicted metal-dependent phosphoesterase TrpH